MPLGSVQNAAGCSDHAAFILLRRNFVFYVQRLDPHCSAAGLQVWGAFLGESEGVLGGQVRKAEVFTLLVYPLAWQQKCFHRVGVLFLMTLSFLPAPL